MKNSTALPTPSQIKVTPSALINKSTTENLGVILVSSSDSYPYYYIILQNVSNIQPPLNTDILVWAAVISHLGDAVAFRLLPLTPRHKLGQATLCSDLALVPISLRSEAKILPGRKVHVTSPMHFYSSRPAPAGPCRHPAQLCLRVFALAVPSTWNALLQKS